MELLLLGTKPLVEDSAVAVGSWLVVSPLQVVWIISFSFSLSQGTGHFKRMSSQLLNPLGYSFDKNQSSTMMLMWMNLWLMQKSSR
jgi:hypothetical protein